MSITFSTCFYIIKSKFDPSIYINWINNFISIVNQFYLVIYTDEQTSKYIHIKNNPRIKVVIKPLTSFYNYKYHENWIVNHAKNVLLNKVSCWELNMLWSEKLWFVKDTIDQRYFDSEMYGWCDIGYFRNRSNDIHTSQLMEWGKLNTIDQNKISYACVGDPHFVNALFHHIQNKNENGLPIQEIPPQQVSVAGGFFVLHKTNIDWWCSTYDEKLQLYFKHDYLVKDDQIILIDCIMSNMERFCLFQENHPYYDNWFMFQRILL